MKVVFTDAEHMTAGQKNRVYDNWKRFVAAVAAGRTGADLFRNFTEPLYHHLIQHCGGFIAHYDRLGFFETYFEEPEETVRFFRQFDPSGDFRSVEGGYDWWVRGGNGTQAPYHDLNNEMCTAIGHLMPTIRNLAAKQQEALDLTRANALLAKHGRPAV
jgi:hypothetical protein